jgi:transcription initiation factor TFIIIB Brf1 subunit/transcription initiation factor TFIIB
MSILFPGIQKSIYAATKTTTPTTPKDDLDLFAGLTPVHQPQNALQCPECLTDAWVHTEEEETACMKCGTFLGYSITSSAEYRWFGADDRNPDPSRVGNPINNLLPESSLGTRIMPRPGEHRSMRKIRQYHLWNVMPYRERTLWNVFEMLQVRAANAGISGAIVEETKQLYAQVSPLCICRGQQKDALMAACLFESLKRHDTPRRPQEIADIFKIDLKLITRGVKQFSGLLDEHLHAAAVAARKEADIPNTTTTKSAAPAAPVIVAQITTPSTNFKHYLGPAILRLDTPRGLLHVVEGLAERIGDMLDELGVCPETTPPSLAACAISLACQHLQTPKPNANVASVCGISLATLQKCMKRIEPWKPALYKNLSN